MLLTHCQPAAGLVCGLPQLATAASGESDSANRLVSQQESSAHSHSRAPRPVAAAMAELRHSTAARASNSPAKRDSDASAASSPFLPSPSTRGSRGGDDDDDGKDVHRSSPLLSHHHHKRAHLLTSPFRSLLALEDPRSPAASSSYRILLALLALLLAAGIFCAPLLWSRLVSSWPLQCLPNAIQFRQDYDLSLTFCVGVARLILEHAVLVPQGGDHAPLP